MSNKENPGSTPRVSKLPLPVSDSPLVIDLPDGQKIVIGKMSQGSVIEVATWRGVGRPDSRTSRLMLGVGTGNVNEPEPSSESTSEVRVVPKPQGVKVALWYLQKYLYNFKKLELSKKIKALFSSGLLKIKKEKSAKQAPSEAPALRDGSSTVSKTEHQSNRAGGGADREIEEWLSQITMNAARRSARANEKAPVKKAVAKKAAVKKASKSTKRK